MWDIGFDKPLYMLPFDHRGSFQTQLFRWKGAVTPEQSAQITSAKQVIFDGFKAAVTAGVPRESAGILIDEQFGAAILRDAVASGYLTACSAEKSAQQEFDFEYGDEFYKHIEAFRPTFCEVLVRYNPEGDTVTNKRQAARLRRLSEYLHSYNVSFFMFELLVPPLETQLARVKGDKRAYELELRPQLVVQAIDQLQRAQVEPDVWKIEGLDRREDCGNIVAAARNGGRDKVSCIIQGRGEDGLKVRSWLSIAAAVPGFVGFAVGRTIFWEPLKRWRDGTVDRSEAVNVIATRYQEFVGVFRERMPDHRWQNRLAPAVAR